MARAAQALFVISLASTLLSCGSPVEQAGVEPVSQPVPPTAVSLRMTDIEGYRETLARHRGKVVLVDFWATWCAPCLAQFPHTVELHRKYQDGGLAVISVSLDDPSEAAHVREFLQEQEADFDNLLSEYGGGTEAVDAFGLPGSVPYYRVYGRAGELRHEFGVDAQAERQFTPADIEAAVTELL